MKKLSRKGRIAIAHNTIFFWGELPLKTMTIYLTLTRISKKKIQCLLNTEQFVHKYNLSLCFTNHLKPTLYRIFYLSIPYFLA